MERDELFFKFHLARALNDTYVGWQFKRPFSCKDSWILLSNSKVKQSFLWDRSVNYMSRGKVLKEEKLL